MIPPCVMIKTDKRPSAGTLNGNHVRDNGLELTRDFLVVIALDGCTRSGLEEIESSDDLNFSEGLHEASVLLAGKVCSRSGLQADQ